MKKRGDEDRGPLIDPSDQEVRDWRSPSSFDQWPHVFNLTNCIVGVSILAMPYCLQQCGILLGTVLIGICSLLTKVTCHLLYQGAVLTRRRSFESMASHAFGIGGRRLVELLMVLYLMSSIVSFMVVIGDIGPHVLADYLELQAPTQRLRILVMILVFLFVVLPLSLFRNLNSLSGVSSVTVFFYFIFVLRMLIECIPRIFDGKWSGDVHWWRQDGLLTSLPIVTMALSCQTQLFCVADCIKDPSAAKVDTVVSGAVNICSGLYAAVGLFGYVAFHDVELHGDILLYLQSSFLTQMMKLAFMLSVAVSIPLVLFPSRIAFYNLFLKPDVGEFAMLRMPSLTFILLTVFLLFSCFLVAVIVPNVEFILGITGAMIGSLVTIIIPSLLFITISRGTEQYRSLVLYAKLSVIFGSLMLVGSTWAVLHTEHATNVVDVILPKQIDSEKMEDALKRLEKVKLDLNITKPQDVLPGPEEAMRKKAEEMEEQKIKTVADEVADKLLHEIKEQRKEQEEILKKQQAIVDELNKHHEMHVKETEKQQLEQKLPEDEIKKAEETVEVAANENLERRGRQVDQADANRRRGKGSSNKMDEAAVSEQSFIMKPKNGSTLSRQTAEAAVPPHFQDNESAVILAARNAFTTSVGHLGP